MLPNKVLRRTKVAARASPLNPIAWAGRDTAVMATEDLIELLEGLLGLAELSGEALTRLARAKSWEVNAAPDLLEVVIGGRPLFLSLVEGSLVAVLTVLGLEDEVEWGTRYHHALRDAWQEMITDIIQSQVGAPAIVSTPKVPTFAHATWIGANVSVGLDESDFDDAFPPAIVLSCVNNADQRGAGAVSLRLGGAPSSLRSTRG